MRFSGFTNAIRLAYIGGACPGMVPVRGDEKGDEKMTFVGLINETPIEITVRKLHAGDDVWRDNVIFYGAAEEGEWQLTISTNAGDSLVSRTRQGMIDELDAAGFEYVPQKRIYRRG